MKDNAVRTATEQYIEHFTQGVRGMERTAHSPIKTGVLWCAFGAALGMTGMVYVYEHQPKPKPVVVEIERSAAPTDPSRVPAALVKLTTVNRAMLAQLEQRERFTVKP